MELSTATARTWLIRAVIAVAVLAGIGLVLLWPRGEAPDLGAPPNRYVDATATEVRSTTCPAVEVDADTGCQQVVVEITSGRDKGSSGIVLIRDIDFRVPRLDVGDRIVLLDVDPSPPPYRYVFMDFQRSSPMIWLLLAFMAVVVGFGRWQGVRALAGLAASAFIVVAFVVPALLRDQPAVPVALTGTVVIAFLALYLAHGINPATTVALAGTLVSLTLIVALALVGTSLTRLSGLADADSQLLRVTADALNLRGLLVAGIVIGALGVLDDVTVSQVSTVSALRRANPSLGRVGLYREAIRVGRDHVAATVNTLVLAYAGAALPLVLFFVQGNQPVGRILTSEIVAVEIVRMLVGSIGLILSVPITTGLAALVLTGNEPDTHHHHHHHDIPAGSAGPAAVLTATAPDWEDFAPE